MSFSSVFLFSERYLSAHSGQLQTHFRRPVDEPVIEVQDYDAFLGTEGTITLL